MLDLIMIEEVSGAESRLSYLCALTGVPEPSPEPPAPLLAEPVTICSTEQLATHSKTWQNTTLAQWEAFKEENTKQNRQSYPLLEGETLHEDGTTVLAAPYLGFRPAGNVVYWRKTNRASLFIISATTRIDLATGQSHQKAASSFKSVEPTAPQMSFATAAEFDEETLVDCATTFVMFSAPALGPAGMVAAAGVAVFQVLFKNILHKPKTPKLDFQRLANVVERVVTAAFTREKILHLKEQINETLRWVRAYYDLGWADDPVTREDVRYQNFISGLEEQFEPHANALLDALEKVMDEPDYLESYLLFMTGANLAKSMFNMDIFARSNEWNPSANPNYSIGTTCIDRYIKFAKGQRTKIDEKLAARVAQITPVDFYFTRYTSTHGEGVVFFKDNATGETQEQAITWPQRPGTNAPRDSAYYTEPERWRNEVRPKYVEKVSAEWSKPYYNGRVEKSRQLVTDMENDYNNTWLPLKDIDFSS
ncbi:hypothetical protein SCOR_24295 [Sulfidibacter corallicola]|uniref:Uncharacterized protein n=1 Tax=Sulfidibacter corallicola TaxID=2818388 RepID=A0A8A4TSE3_SULCO|nr:hypothetical protein [Sulfidibacter corallicola]QTD52470.1 hypothetical protein J3U87_08360 [Sulfidibacter corallicola]